MTELQTSRVRVYCRVHHIDKNKDNNDDKNLITYCSFCHQDAHNTFLQL
ncbi:MAG: HNH endonuclease [Candidatus Hodarchaeales archaeon]